MLIICIEYITLFGEYITNIIHRLGHFTLFAYQFIIIFIKKPLHRDQFIQQMYLVGIQSFGIVFLTGCFAGLALTMQSYYYPVFRKPSFSIRSLDRIDQ